MLCTDTRRWPHINASGRIMRADFVLNRIPYAGIINPFARGFESDDKKATGAENMHKNFQSFLRISWNDIIFLIWKF